MLFEPAVTLFSVMLIEVPETVKTPSTFEVLYFVIPLSEGISIVRLIVPFPLVV